MKKLVLIIKRYSFFLISILTVSFIVILIGLVQRADSNFWTNFWTVEAAICTAIIAVLGIFYEIDYNKNEKAKDLEDEIRKRKADNYERSLDLVNFEGSPTLIKWYDFLENSDKTDKVTTSMKSKIVVVLYKYSKLKQTRAQFEDTEDVSDYLYEKVILRNVINHRNFINVKKEIILNFPDLRDIIDSILGQGEVEMTDQNHSSSSNNLDKTYPYILGNWIMKKEYADKVKYLVGISNETKKIIAIYKVRKNSKIDDRIKFDGRLIFSEKDILEKNNEIPILENWTSRNPVLYYNMWAKSYEVEERNKLWSLIEQFDLEESGKTGNIVTNTEIINNRSILVVKTNQY